MMFRNGNPNKTPARMCGILAVGLFLTASFAANGLVRDRRVNMAEAQQMAVRAAEESDFPIVANEKVVKQLNRFVGTPDGRRFMRDSLRRMEAYQALIREKLEQYNLPEELMAIPLLESGYRSLAPNEAPPHAAGLWQFIPETARKFNLVVDEEVDQRLDDQRATDAALRYLGALHLRFQDWALAVLAYNAGERLVQKGIEETGQRDAWTLIDAKFQNDNDYLSKAMAVMLIIKNPSILD